MGVVAAYSNTVLTPESLHCNLVVGYASTLLLGGLMRQDRLLYWEHSWLAVFAGGSRFEPLLPTIYLWFLVGFFRLYRRNLCLPYFIFLLVSHCHVLLLNYPNVL